MSNDPVKKLEHYFRNTPQYIQDRHMFEFDCDWYGVDVNDPHAKFKIKMKKFWERLKHHILPKVYYILANIACGFSYCLSGVYLMIRDDLWWIAFLVLGICFQRTVNDMTKKYNL